MKLAYPYILMSQVEVLLVVALYSVMVGFRSFRSLCRLHLHKNTRRHNPEDGGSMDL